MAEFIISGGTVIDLKISELIVLSFTLPAISVSSFYSSNLVANLAALLGVSSDLIRRVDIVSANNNTRLHRRQTSSTIVLTIEIRYDPSTNLSDISTIQSEDLATILSSIINRYQSGQLQTDWSANSALGNVSPSGLSVQEPLNQTTVSLGVIDRIALITPPSSCREQSPCSVQPVLVAYDSSGNIIDKLGSNDQPWQIIATVVNQSNVTLIGDIANYTNGQTQFTTFGFPYMGEYQVEFSFIPPDNVSRYFRNTKN
jgi:hypothetical protein